MIAAEEDRLLQHVRKRKNLTRSYQSLIEDARLLLRNQEAWSEQTTEVAFSLDNELKESLIPPKRLMEVLQGYKQDEFEKSQINGAFRLFIPFYLATFSIEGQTREEIISPGQVTKGASSLTFRSWEAIGLAVRHGWDKVSKDLQFLRNLEKSNLIKNRHARSLILDGLRSLKDKDNIIDKKTYENLVEGVRLAFQSVIYEG